MKKTATCLLFFVMTHLCIIAQNNSEIKIGTQIWMSQNLNVDTFRNGDPIPQARNIDEYTKSIETGSPIWCYYNFDAANENIYGKLYNCFAVKDKRGLAPKGWKIPVKNELQTLISFLGGERIAIDKLKSNSGWSSNGNNSSGFSGLPGGILREDKFEGLGNTADWWSATLTNDGIDAAYTLGLYEGNSISIQPSVMWLCMSVRCLKIK